MRFASRVVFVLACLSGAASSARAAAQAEDILPENTLAAFVIPDLAAARGAASSSKIGEMFAQPEMQQFLKPVLAELRNQYEQLRKTNPMIASIEDVDAALLSGELAVGLGYLQDKPSGFASVWIMLRPKDMAALQRSLIPPMRDALAAGKPLSLGGAGRDGKEMGPFLALTADRLIFCADEFDLKWVLARAGAAAPADSLSKIPAFASLKAASPNAAALVYIAPDRLMNFLHHFSKNVQRAPEADAYRNLMIALGMQNTTAWSAALNFRNGLPTIEGGLRLKGPAADGLAALFVPAKASPPAADAFAIAAPDAPFVSAGYMNFAQLIPLIRQCARAMSPATAQQLDQQFQELTRQVLQCDIQKDVLEAIGPEYVAVQTPTDTSTQMSFFPGMVYSFTVRDSEKLEATLKRAGEMINALPEQFSSQYSFKKATLAGNSAYYIAGMLAPASPIVCFAKKRLLVGTSINALRRVLEQINAPKNILSNQTFQDTIARVTGKPFDAANLPTAFTYGVDSTNGGGSLLLAGGYIAGAAGVTGALAEIPVPGQARAKPAPADANPVMEFVMRPSGRVLLPISAAVDISLWPDEGFFQKYRMSTASFMLVEPNAVTWRTEMPAPTPSGGGPSIMVVTATVAIIAAIAVPSLLRSRMAANETAAAAGCKMFAQAQEIYHRMDYDKDGVLEYAQSINELNFAPGGNVLGLVDLAFLGAEAAPGKIPTPKAGYFFKVLKGQSAAVEGGKKSYLVKGNMTLGYALVAYPAQYDSTGRSCFMISNSGTIYQADLGPRTAELMEQMTEFDPAYGGAPWVPAE